MCVCTCGKSGSEALSYNSFLCLEEDDDMRARVCVCVRVYLRAVLGLIVRDRMSSLLAQWVEIHACIR